MFIYSTKHSTYNYIVVNTNFVKKFKEDSDYGDILKHELKSYGIEPIFAWYDYYDGESDGVMIYFDEMTRVSHIRNMNMVHKLTRKDISMSGIIVCKKILGKLNFNNLLNIYDAVRMTEYCTVYGIEYVSFIDDYLYAQLDTSE